MIQIQSEAVLQLELLINHTFTNKDFGWEALQCKGCGGYPDGNKRLALLGDVGIKMMILKKWYPTGRDTRIADDIVKNSATNAQLTFLGRRVGLEPLINPNPSQRGIVSSKQIADAVEAVVGAVYVDGGENALEDVMERLGLL